MRDAFPISDKVGTTRGMTLQEWYAGLVLESMGQWCPVVAVVATPAWHAARAAFCKDAAVAMIAAMDA